MLKQFRALIANALILWFLSSANTYAVNVSITDNCQRTVSGSPASSTSVAANGDISVSGLSGSYVPALGGCDTYTINDAPVCTLSASQTTVQTGSTVTLYAKCSLAPSTYSWRGPPGGPAAPASPTTTPSIQLTFPNPGAYT